MSTERKVPHINFSFVYPPIPLRDYDWQATLDGYEGGDHIGYGATKEDAMVDLLAKVEDDEAYCACCKPLMSEQEQRNGVCDGCL